MGLCYSCVMHIGFARLIVHAALIRISRSQFLYLMPNSRSRSVSTPFRVCRQRNIRAFVDHQNSLSGYIRVPHYVQYISPVDKRSLSDMFNIPTPHESFCFNPFTKIVRSIGYLTDILIDRTCPRTSSVIARANICVKGNRCI